MENVFREIIDGLDEKRSRSRLEPYHTLIMELRRRRRTYREIQRILRERFQIQVAASTLHEFLRIRRKTGSAGHVAGAGQPMLGKTNATEEPPRGKPGKPAPASTPDEVRERIAALKRRRPEPEEPGFRYDPDKPLTLKADSPG